MSIEKLNRDPAKEWTEGGKTTTVPVAQRIRVWLQQLPESGDLGNHWKSGKSDANFSGSSSTSASRHSFACSTCSSPAQSGFGPISDDWPPCVRDGDACIVGWSSAASIPWARPGVLWARPGYNDAHSAALQEDQAKMEQKGWS